MASFSEKFANLLEYVGVRSNSYYHASTPKAYDPEDPLPYFVDESMRGNYSGPFDDRGLPLYNSDGNLVYLPVFLCFWGLGQLDIYRETKEQSHIDNFVKVVRWLTVNQRPQGDWISTVSMPKFGLTGPHPSAMVQGLAISCLVRGYHITSEDELLQAAIA
ncbi:MAG TPA: hypothetical protein VJ983_00840, partial [candidate division Zixibacteria bacterium]|nr:hypothetical protein [candidate division Zixibacteria bacterium]